MKNEYVPAPIQKRLMDAANNVRINGDLIPRCLRDSLELLDAVLIILKNPEDGNEAAFSGRKVLSIAQEKLWHVSNFLDGEYDYDGCYHVEENLRA